MTQDLLVKHIMFVTRVKDNKGSRAGANALIDLFLDSGRVIDNGGKLVISTRAFENTEASALSTASNTIDVSASPVVEASPAQAGPQNQQIHIAPSPTIAINIQLQIPESKDPEVYESFFKALRTYILDYGKASD